VLNLCVEGGEKELCLKYIFIAYIAE